MKKISLIITDFENSELQDFIIKNQILMQIISNSKSHFCTYEILFISTEKILTDFVLTFWQDEEILEDIQDFNF